MSLDSFFQDRHTPAKPVRPTIRRRLLGRGNRLRTVGSAVALVSLGLTLGQPAHAITRNWDGSVADWYSDPNHWMPTGFPQPGDDARNTFTNAAMTLGQNASVNSFISNSAFTLLGGTFSGATAAGGPSDTANLHTLQVNNIFTLNGGQINNFTLTAGVQQAGAPAPSVVVASNGGNSLSNTVVTANLDLATNTGAFLRFNNTNTIGTSAAAGSITLATFNNNDNFGLRLNNGANLILNSGSTLQGNGDVSQEGSNGSTLTNNGLVNATGGTLLFNQSSFANNAGATAQATGGGTLTVNSSVSNSGAVRAMGAGSVVNLQNSTFTGTGTAAQGNLITASGGGVINVNNETLSGTINTDASTALVILSNGGNNLSDGATVNGNLDLATNAGAFLRVNGTGTVNGTITQGTFNGNDNFGLRLNNGANLILNSGSTLQGNGDVSQEGSNGSTLTNNGLVNATGGTLLFNQSSFANNAGATAQATGGGTLTINSTTTNSGAVRATGAGSVVNLQNSTFTGSGTAAQGNLITASGGGRVNVFNENLLGTINTDAATALVILSNGGNNVNANNGTGSTVINGNLDLATDMGAFLRFNGTDTVNGTITQGTFNNNDNFGLRLNNGANLVIGGGSTLQGFGDVSQEGASGSMLTNNGLVNANSAGNILTMNESTFANTGTAQATGGGTLTLNNATANSGAVRATGAGSVVNLQNATFTGTGTAAQGNLFTASGGGVINVFNETLSGAINTTAATALVIGSNGGNNLSGGTTVNGNLDLATNAGAFLRVNGTGTVNGTITQGTFNGNDNFGLRLNNGANLVIGTTGTLQGSGDVSQERAAGSTLTNNGTINAITNSAGNSLTFNQSNFVNGSTGTTNVANGATLTVNSGSATNSGTVTVLGGGTANFSSGLTQTAGATQVFGTLNASETVSGGVFGGAGTVNGNVTNTGGTIQSVGNNAGGSLLINGNFTQTSGGALDAFFGNNFHNLLTVTGQTTTGGTLGVFDLDFSSPAGTAGQGSTFAFLDYSGTLTPDGSTVNGFTQYFTNEIPDSNTSGKIIGQNGFTFELTNVINPNTNTGMLDLTVLTVGAPVPEASTTVSLGLLLALGLGGLVVTKRKKKAQS